MSWFKREKTPIPQTPDKERKVRTEGVFTPCGDCKKVLWTKELEENDYVCPRCSYHFKVSARRRLAMLFDKARSQEFATELRSSDPLGFKDSKTYRSRLEQAMNETGCPEAVITAEGTLNSIPVVCAAMEYRFIGGSMGSVVGEKITRAIEKSLQQRKALIIVSASGGARMMEGVLSLMQMAKISSSLARLHEARVPYISILTNPTTGGVTASFAMLGDLNIAEPRALIGFAGPRVIEQTIRQKLPGEFQKSEFLLEHGMLDAVVPRAELRDYISDWLTFMLP